MNKKEIKDILDTIDILKYIAERGQKELKNFSHYLAVFGFYAAINVFLTLITKNHLLWLYTLPLAFFFSSIHIAGPIPALLVWTASTLITIIIAISPLPKFFLSISIGIIAFLSYYLLYSYSIKKGKNKVYNIKTAIIPKIGLLWGFTMFLTFYILSICAKIIGSSNVNNITTILYSYAIGICFFATGIIIPFFYILALLQTLLVPLIYYLNPKLGYSLYGILSLIMGIYGIYIIKRK